MICRAGRTDSRSFNAGVRERSVSVAGMRSSPTLQLLATPFRLRVLGTVGKQSQRLGTEERRIQSIPFAAQAPFLFPQDVPRPRVQKPLSRAGPWGSRRVLQSSRLCGGKALAGTCVVPGSVSSVPQAEMSAASSSCHPAPELACSIPFPVMLSMILNLFFL